MLFRRVTTLRNSFIPMKHVPTLTVYFINEIAPYEVPAFRGAVKSQTIFQYYKD